MPAWFAGSRLRGACGVRPDDGGLVARLEAGRASAAEISRAHDHRGPLAGGCHRDWAVVIEVAGELLYKRLPFDEGGRVVRLETQDTAASRVEPRVLHDFSIWRRSLKTVVELGAARVSERNVLTGEGRVESLRVAEITASAFPLTRVPPLLGRPLQPADEMQGGQPVVVLGYDVWQRQFLHDPAIIGRVVTVGRTARTVVGVMPPRFGFPRNQQAWVPLPIQDALPREGPAVQVFGRLASGASWRD